MSFGRMGAMGSGFGRMGAVGGGQSAPAFVGELDTIDNVYAAHSTKRVLSSYTGPLVRLRRSSDNAELDFEATESGWLDAAAITTWLGGGTGFVRTVYDQSGNSRPAAQTTSGNQPSIKLSGTNPTINFNGTDQFLSVPSALSFARNVGAMSILATRKFAATSADQQIIGIGNNSTVARATLVMSNAEQKVRASGRRLDADSAGSTTGFTPSTEWKTQVGRFDYTNSDLHHVLEYEMESNTSFQTSGSTSDTDSSAIYVGQSAAGTQRFSGELTVVAFIRDLLTEIEANALVDSLDNVKGIAAHDAYRLTNTTTVSTGAGIWKHAAARVPHQRQAFYAAGRYWLFWGDYSGGGSGPFNLNFRSSVDGSTWSSDTTLTTFPIADTQWSISYDDATGKVHVAKNTQSVVEFHEGLQYRRGTPNSDGSITWDAAFQTVIATGNFVGDFNLAVATDGRAWVGYGDNGSDSATKGNAKVVRNGATDGTWSTASGFPATVHAGSVDDAFAVLVPIANGEMHAAVYEWGSDAVVPGYTIATDGTVASDGNISGQSIETAGVGGGALVGRVETAARDGVVHLVYTRSGGNEVRYRRRAENGTWGTEVVLATGLSDTIIASPRISFDGDSNILVMWSWDKNSAWAAKSEDDGANWGGAYRIQGVTSLEPTYEHMMPAEQSNGSGTVQVVYLTAAYGLVHGLMALP